jgi:hypothetical protein
LHTVVNNLKIKTLLDHLGANMSNQSKRAKSRHYSAWRIVAACAVLIASGCAIQQPARPIFPISAQFDFAEAKRLMSDGRNTIRGNAFLRQRGGGVVTCAGSPVFLVPATAYARERIERIYGERTITTLSNPIFEPDPSEYRATTKNTKCDAQGNFVFERVADGEFFVTTQVLWEIAHTVQGGAVMQRVIVKDGQVVNIVIAS